MSKQTTTKANQASNLPPMATPLPNVVKDIEAERQQRIALERLETYEMRSFLVRAGIKEAADFKLQIERVA